MPWSDDDLRAYIEGRLGETEAGPDIGQLEEAFFADDELFARMRAIEDDVLDDLAAGRLPPKVEAHVLAGRAQADHLDHRLDLARALHATRGERSREVAAVDTGSWYRRAAARLRDWCQRNRWNLAVPAVAVAVALIVVLRPDAPSVTAARLTIHPSTTRNAAASQTVALVVPGAALELTVMLEPDLPAPPYRIELAGGESPWSSAAVTPRPGASSVAIEVPASALRPGAQTAILRSATDDEPLTYYRFVVESPE